MNQDVKNRVMRAVNTGKVVELLGITVQKISDRVSANGGKHNNFTFDKWADFWVHMECELYNSIKVK